MTHEERAKSWYPEYGYEDEIASLAEQFREVEREAQGPARALKVSCEREWDSVVAALGEHAHLGLTPAENVVEIVALVGRLEAQVRDVQHEVANALNRTAAKHAQLKSTEDLLRESEAQRKLTYEALHEAQQEAERGRVNQAELRSARDERDHWKTTAECHAALIMKAQDAAGWAMDIDALVEKLLAQIRNLRVAGDALQDTGAHLPSCSAFFGAPYVCNCGWVAAGRDWDAATKGIER